MKFKFIEAKELKAKYANHVIGIELEEKDGFKAVVGVGRGDEDISIHELCVDSYKFTKADPNKVEDYFRVAVLKLSSDLNEAESDLLIAKRHFNFAQMQLDKYFKTNKTKHTKGVQNANRPTT